MLHKNISEIQSTLTANLHDIADEVEIFPDPCDMATFETYRGAWMMSKERQQQAIVMLKQAIRRIDDGTFETCGVCGMRIPEKRLLANPTTLLCIDCREAAERRLYMPDQ
jgi:DnaK suppressor protein